MNYTKLLMCSHLRFNFSKTISSTMSDYNLINDLTNSGWNGVMPVLCIITNNSSITSSSGENNYAINIGELPNNSIVYLNNNGSVTGSSVDSLGYGGTAIKTKSPLIITNNGTISGGTLPSSIDLSPNNYTYYITSSYYNGNAYLYASNTITTTSSAIAPNGTWYATLSFNAPSVGIINLTHLSDDYDYFYLNDIQYSYSTLSASQTTNNIPVPLNSNIIKFAVTNNYGTTDNPTSLYAEIIYYPTYSNGCYLDGSSYTSWNIVGTRTGFAV